MTPPLPPSPTVSLLSLLFAPPNDSLIPPSSDLLLSCFSHGSLLPFIFVCLLLPLCPSACLLPACLPPRLPVLWRSKTARSIFNHLSLALNNFPAVEQASG